MRTDILQEKLQACIAACNHCMSASLQEKDVAMMRDCIVSDIDCSRYCTLVLDFITRKSAHANHLLKECIEICEQCARICDEHAHMDHCKACAIACRECAEACKTELS